MKQNTLFSFLLSSFCITVYAQNPQMEYRPFAQDGKTWEIQIGEIMENCYGNRVDGDTVIGGETWKKVYNYIGFPYTDLIDAGISIGETDDINYSYYAAIRDVGKKVYAIAKGSNRPRLLYDFGLKVGDMVRCGAEGNDFACLLNSDDQPDRLMGFKFVYYLRVERIDTITSCGLQHRCFKLSMLDSYEEPLRCEEDGGMFRNIVWIEGVGSSAGPFSPWLPLPPRGCSFLSCMVNRTYLFGYPDLYENQNTDSSCDVNGDGKVDVADIAKVIDSMAGQTRK